MEVARPFLLRPGNEAKAALTPVSYPDTHPPTTGESPVTLHTVSGIEHLQQKCWSSNSDQKYNISTGSLKFLPEVATLYIKNSAHHY